MANRPTNNTSKHYIQRLRAGINPDSTSLVRFIKEETFINLKPYSFLGHEFQQYFTELIEKDPNVDITAEKCSQIGLSEVCFRIVLGLMALIPGFAVLYAMPSKTLAMEVLKTRLSLIINSSPILRELISRDVDSASVKMFKNESILYALGASANSSASLLNRPINLVVIDEVDKCDEKVYTGFDSRQTHSAHKPRIAISTPTAPGIGINAEAENRQLHYQVVICHKCKHEYIPDYYEQVKLPGFKDPISTLTAEKIRQLHLDTDLAYHHCPKCHEVSNLLPKYKQWVIENEQLRKIHVRLTPFDAPEFIKPKDLINSQVSMSSRSEFDNQKLGLPSRMSDATIDRSSIEFTRAEVPSGIPIAGVDFGKTNHYMQGVLKDGIIFVHGYETMPVNDVKRLVEFNIKTQNLVSVVGDSLPFLDITHQLTISHPQYWGAVYSVPRQPQPELFKLKVKEEEQVRQVNIQKNLFMDHVAGMIAAKQIVFKSGAFDESLVQHFTDMRRVRDHKFSEMRYKWVKSAKGVDHWWHTLCYLVCASKVIQKTSNTAQLPTGFLMRTFKNLGDL